MRVNDLRKINRFSLAPLFLPVALAALFVQPVTAQSGTWGSATPGNLLSGANWVGGVIPNSTDASATIGTNLTTAGNFTLNGSITVGSLTFGPLGDGGGNTYHVASGGTGVLDFQTSTGSAAIDTSQSGSVLDLYDAGAGPSITLTSSLNVSSTTVGGNPNLILGNLSGNGGLTVGPGATVALQGTNNYSGGTTITADPKTSGTLIVGSDAALGAPGSGLTVMNAGTLQTSAPITTSRPVQIMGTATVNTAGFNSTFNSTITDQVAFTGGLVVTGAGSLTLTAANTYGRGTDVNGGTLYVDNTTGSGTGTNGVNVYFGGTLAGTGSIKNSVSVSSASTISPGDGPGKPGTLTVGDDLMVGTASMNFQLGAPGTIGGGVNSLINVGGTYSTSGNVELSGTVNVTALTGFTVGAYRLVNYTREFHNSGLNLGALPAGFSQSMLDFSHPGQINLYVITIPGDVDGNEIVNGQDIGVLASHWLNSGFSVPGDANFDGIVNGQDIAVIATNWLHTGGAGSGTPAPEPSTATLVVLAALGLLGRQFYEQLNARRSR